VTVPTTCDSTGAGCEGLEGAVDEAGGGLDGAVFAGAAVGPLAVAGWAAVPFELLGAGAGVVAADVWRVGADCPPGALAALLLGALAALPACCGCGLGVLCARNCAGVGASGAGVSGAGALLS
jgi:hypothetical protein